MYVCVCLHVHVYTCMIDAWNVVKPLTYIYIYVHVCIIYNYVCIPVISATMKKVHVRIYVRIMLKHA